MTDQPKKDEFEGGKSNKLPPELAAAVTKFLIMQILGDVLGKKKPTDASKVEAAEVPSDGGDAGLIADQLELGNFLLGLPHLLGAVEPAATPSSSAINVIKYLMAEVVKVGAVPGTGPEAPAECTCELLTFADLRNVSRADFTDISTEKYRTYHYDDGSAFTIREPIALAISPAPSFGHRVLDAHGECFYIRTGWRQISWDVKVGAPHFSF